MMAKMKMKNIMKYVILCIMLFVAMTACSTFVLYVFKLILKIEYENIVFSGFKVAFVAMVLLGAGWFVKRKRSGKSKE